MRIAIDARTYNWTGVGRYTRNLIRALGQVPQKHDFFVLLTPEDAKQYAGPFEYGLVEPSYYSLREQVVFLQQLNRLSVDLVHFTHFNMPLLYRGRSIVTIHDTTRFLFPGQKQQTALQQIAYEIVFKHAVEHAEQVIAVSHAAARDLQRLPVHMRAAPVVVYEGVEESFQIPVAAEARSRIRDHLATQSPYFLYVGLWMSHKNIERLLIAFRSIVVHRKDIKLVLTGSWRPGYVDVPALVKKYQLEENVILPGFVPHDLLPALYAEALALVFPSLYEGFGLPLLEAASLGTPVITSLVSSLPEIMGTAALYVNPESVTSIATGLQTALNDPLGLNHLADSAQERVQQFQWKKTAEQTQAVYDKLAT